MAVAADAAAAAARRHARRHGDRARAVPARADCPRRGQRLDVGRRHRLVAAAGRLRDRHHGSARLRGHGQSVGRRARRLGRCRPDAVDRPWGRLLSGLADPLGDGALVGIGALVDCLGVAVRRDLLHLRGDHGGGRETRARLPPPAQAGSAAALLEAAPWIVAMGGQGRGPGDDLRPIGKRRRGRNRRLRPERSSVPATSRSTPTSRMLAAPEIAGLPQLASMLLAAGCLVCALAAASLVLFAIGASLGHDLYFRGIEPRAPMSRRLLAQRLSLLLATGLAACCRGRSAGRLSAAGVVVVRRSPPRACSRRWCSPSGGSGRTAGARSPAWSPASPSPPISSRQTPSIPSSTSTSNRPGWPISRTASAATASLAACRACRHRLSVVADRRAAC